MNHSVNIKLSIIFCGGYITMSKPRTCSECTYFHPYDYDDPNGKGQCCAFGTKRPKEGSDGACSAAED